MKRIISLLIALILIFAMAAPAFATEYAGSVAESRVKGYTSATVVINHVPTNYSASLYFDNSKGVYSVINVENLRVARQHGEINVTYYVRTYGNISELGGRADRYGVGETRSDYVKSRYGMSQVASVVNMRTTFSIYGDDPINASISV